MSSIIFPQTPIVDDRGNLSLEWQEWLQNPQYLTLILGAALEVASGGTGLVSGTSGGVLGFIGTTTIASSALLTSHALVIGGGAGSVPSTSVGLGTNVQVLHGNAAGDPTWGLVSLTSDVAGVLPLANFDASTLVPYTGATGAVNLGTQTLAAGNTSITGTMDVSGLYKAGGASGVAAFGPAAVASITIKNGIVTAIS